MTININKLNIKFNKEDLMLPDVDLYLKTYNDYIENNNISDFDMLKEEMTVQLNLARNRTLCCVCDGVGLTNGNKCLICNGHGHI